MAERLLIRALKGGKNTKIVSLNGKNITKIPSALEKLPGLKTLYLRNNQISKMCPEISNLTQLTALNLGNNLLEEVPEEMKYLTSLKKLHLFRNKIHRFASGVCDGLQSLILLNLNNNQLTWIPGEIGRLKNLRCLSINHNQLASIPRELCFLENLSELQINYNQLVCIPKEIKFLKKLQQLLLARNNIKSLPEGLCDLFNLRILDVAGNVIQMFPTGFQDLKLREFYCEGNPLFLKQPASAIKQESVWSLQEITSRFIMNQLAEKNPFLMKAIKWYPQVRSIISQGRKCAICGKFFLTTWLKCVEFFPPSKIECMRATSLQSCLTLCDPVDCSPPGSSVHGILQQESWSGLPRPPSGIFLTQDRACTPCGSCSVELENKQKSTAVTSSNINLFL